MTDHKRRTLTLANDTEVGRLLLALKDTRRRTKESLANLPDELVDAGPPSGGSSIGSLLYHLAIIEADWLFDDILGTQETDWPSELFPVDVRDDGEHLSDLEGETLDDHLARLEKVRTMLVEVIETMSEEDLHRMRERKHYDVSPAWVLHHLMQHEAEHRSQIGSIREALGVGAGW